MDYRSAQTQKQAQLRLAERTNSEGLVFNEIGHIQDVDNMEIVEKRRRMGGEKVGGQMVSQERVEDSLKPNSDVGWAQVDW